MIRSFGDKDTEALWNRHRVRRYQAFERVAQRKLAMLNAARTLSDLRGPGLGLEALKRDLAGFHGFRINDQWRIIFRWEDGGAYDVAIVDYH